MTINNHYVEAVVDSGTEVSVLSRILYDSLSCRPRPVESIRLKGASASGVMVDCRVDGVEVDLGDGHGNYSMTCGKHYRQLYSWFGLSKGPQSGY